MECADSSYYTGSTNNIEVRIKQHQDGKGTNHTKKRLPVTLVYTEEFQRIDEAFYREKQVQGWSRKKKEALINGQHDKLPKLSMAYRDLKKMASVSSTSTSGEVLPVPEVLEGTVSRDSTSGDSGAQLNDLRKLVHGEDSDLYDVLNYISYHKELVPRVERAEKAKIHFQDYNPKQQEFLNFVLEQYVKVGVDELDDEKLSPLLILKYKAIADAKRELGGILEIRNAFVGFQQHLYGQVVGSAVS